MSPESLQRNRKKIIVSGVLLLIIIIGTVLFLTRPGSIVLHSETGADIYISTEKGGEFKKIGTSQATYKTRKVPSTIYVMTTKDAKKTVSSALVKRGDNGTSVFSLSDKVNALEVSDGVVFNAYIEGRSIQGIEPNEFRLINFSDNPDELIKPGLAQLPYVKKVVWYDAQNLVYKSFKGGIGRLINGIPTKDEGVGDSISGAGLDEITDDTTKIDDISRYGSLPLVLLSKTNIFTSSDMGTSLRSIASFNSIDDGETHSLFTTGQHVFHLSSTDPSSYASESGSVSTDRDNHDSVLTQYDYSGVKTGEFVIQSESTIKSLAEKNGTIYALTNEKLIQIKDNKVSDVDLYFLLARDLILYKETIILLGDDGVWKLGDDGVSIQLLHDFPNNGVGLAQSFSISGESLVFGTQAKPGETNIATKMLSIRF